MSCSTTPPPTTTTITTSSTPSSSVESTISSCASTSTTTAVTVSASAPNVLGNNGKHNDMKLWCNTVVAVESDGTTSSTQESDDGKSASASSSTTSKADAPRKSPLQQQRPHQQQHQKRYNRKQYSNGGSSNSGSGGSGYPPTFGQCPTTSRTALAYEQLEELMRLCNHEYQSNESYYHAINALLRQIQEVRINSPPPSGAASRAQSADIVTPICSLPSAPINRALPHRLFRRIEVPENPTFNLIGRVLGPRGLTVRELESRFSCRIYVRGQGSIRDPEKAKKLLDKPGWEHLTEDLHILVIAGGTNKADVEGRLDSACDFINRLLHPRGFDSFKRRQLVSLALLNGTFRPQHFQQFEHRPDQSPHLLHHNQIGVH